MDRLIFRTWYSKTKSFNYFDFDGFNDSELYTLLNYATSKIEQSSGLKDKNDNLIFEGDIVYVAGYGDYVCEFPFAELYEAYPEGDIGAIKGNIHERDRGEE